MMIDESGSAFFIKAKPPSIDKPSPVNVCMDVYTCTCRDICMYIHDMCIYVYMYMHVHVCMYN